MKTWIYYFQFEQPVDCAARSGEGDILIVSDRISPPNHLPGNGKLYIEDLQRGNINHP